MLVYVNYKDKPRDDDDDDDVAFQHLLICALSCVEICLRIKPNIKLLLSNQKLHETCVNTLYVIDGILLNECFHDMVLTIIVSLC